MRLYDDSPKKDEPEERPEESEQPERTPDDRMFDPPWMWGAE